MNRSRPPIAPNDLLISALALALLGLTVACGPQTEATNCGTDAEKFSVEQSDYCVYTKSKPITETGFQCPAGFPHRQTAGDVTFCSSDKDVPDKHTSRIEKEYTAEDPSTGDEEVGQNARFTQCEETDKTAMYCAAERLKWSWDSQSKVAQFDHRRVTINCCGERTTKAFKRGEESYEIREIDRGEGENDDLRCGCMCVFDFGIDIPEVDGVIDLAIVRETINGEMTDEETVWEGKVDLSEGSGEIVTSMEDASPWCMNKNSDG
jgi:hypothetical protein